MKGVIAFSALLSFTTACATTATRAQQPETVPQTLHCCVRRVESDSGDAKKNFKIEMKLEGSGQTFASPVCLVRPDEWAEMKMGQNTTRLKEDSLPMEEVQVLDTGTLVQVRCSDREDGKVGIDVRAFYVRDGRVVWSVKDVAKVNEGEDFTFNGKG